MDELRKKVKAHRKPVSAMKKHELEDYANRHHLWIDLMTKEEVLKMISMSGCAMLKGLKVDKMTREQLIEHLHKSKCPELAKYL
jgi:DNA phosphorothioation-dependent restriction protein DptG